MVIAAGIALLTLLINLPFGYMRKKTRKFSLKWFLCIHLPTLSCVLWLKCMQATMRRLSL